MYEKIANIISAVLKIPKSELSEDFMLRDAETWDSLRHMELIGALEQAFAIDFTFDEIIAMQTLSDIRRIFSVKGVGH